MANIKTAKQLAYEAALDERLEHRRRCPGNVFPSYSYGKPKVVDGDIKRCEHGIILEYRGRDRWGKPWYREIVQKRHPILYRRAIKLLAEEEALRAEERDGGD